MAIYMKAKDTQGNTSVNLLVVKARVAPIKTITLPRLELMGALRAAKRVNHVVGSLYNLNCDVFFCTDSSIVLGWILGDLHRWDTFVANRVTKIRSFSDKHQWHHCPRSQNRADCLT